MGMNAKYKSMYKPGDVVGIRIPHYPINEKVVGRVVKLGKSYVHVLAEYVNSEAVATFKVKPKYLELLPEVKVDTKAKKKRSKATEQKAITIAEAFTQKQPTQTLKATGYNKVMRMSITNALNFIAYCSDIPLLEDILKWDERKSVKKAAFNVLSKLQAPEDKDAKKPTRKRTSVRKKSDKAGDETKPRKRSTPQSEG